MQALFAIISLLGVIGIALWWSTFHMSPISQQEVVTSERQVTTNNPITDPIKQAEEVRDAVETRNLNTLDLSGQGLTKVPEYVFGRTDLEKLDVSNNTLTGALQAEVRHLQNLKILDLSNNAFTGVPAEVGQLKNLEILDLSNNELTGLPYELGNLQKLKLLKLTGNNYATADLEMIKKTLPTDTRIEVD